MDTLSNVLSLLRPHSRVRASGFSAGGEWSMQCLRPEGVKCYAVVTGACWLTVDGVPDPVRMEAGDCFLLPLGRSFRLASDLALPPVDIEEVFSQVRDGGIAVWNGGGDFFIVGSIFALASSHAGVLLGMLPPVVHIRKDSDQEALRWSVERMMQEVREKQPGSFLVVQHLAHMMLVQALRVHLAEESTKGVGWIFVLSDRQIGAAINAMHEEPAHRWTLQELAERAGMSRSSFALKFKESVGSSPMEYLTRWRMLLADDRLVNSGDSISDIAQSLGYESESAFSTAFKRVMGRSPRQQGRGRNSVPMFGPDEKAVGGNVLAVVKG